MKKFSRSSLFKSNYINLIAPTHQQPLFTQAQSSDFILSLLVISSLILFHLFLNFQLRKLKCYLNEAVIADIFLTGNF
jgi:hypothetical protein